MVETHDPQHADRALGNLLAQTLAQRQAVCGSLKPAPLGA
jgi:hypothetical protein